MQSAKSAEQYIDALVSQDFMIQLNQEAEQLRKSLTTSLEPVAEDLAAKLQSMVEAMIPRTQSLQKQLNLENPGDPGEPDPVQRRDEGQAARPLPLYP